MVALISILALVALGFVWWWVVQPHEESRRESRDTQLPLYTTRTPGRGVSIVVPSLVRSAVSVAAPVAAMAAAAPAAEAPSAARGAGADGAPEASARRSTTGSTIERVFTTVPWVEPEAVRSPAPPPAGTDGHGSSNGRGPSAEPSAAAAPPPRASAPSPRPSFAPPGVTARAAPSAPAASDPTQSEAERWGPRPEHDPSGTVQFLPGRLEVLQGRTMQGQEIRFVRPERAGDRAVVTFGRGEGAPYRHVQLKVPTVSRRHARMSLEPGTDRWLLENLSSTNPVAVNGVDLAEGAAPVALSDGDRVEMGEIVFVFRAR